MTIARWSLLGLTVGLFACAGDKDTTDTDAPSESDTPTDTDTDSDADSDTDSDTDSDADTDSDTDSDTDADTGDTAPGTDPNLWNLTLTGTGYTPHVGQTMTFAVVRGTTVLTTNSLVLDASAEINQTWVDVLEGNGEEFVAWYADSNGDGMCTGIDHVWTYYTSWETYGPFDVVLTRDHGNMFDTDGCNYL